MSMHGGAEYNLMAGLGKQGKSLEQGLVKQGYAQGGNSATQTIEQKLQLQVQGVLVGGKGVEGATSQGFSVSLSPSSNRGSTVGPGPLGLASVAAVMAPQGHAMIHSMAEGGRSQGVRGPQLQLGVGSGHSNMMHHHHQQHPLMQLQHSQLQHAQSNLQHQAPQQQAVQAHQLQQHRGGSNARSVAGGAEDNRGGADGTYSSGVGLGREREVVEDRKVHGRRPSGGASSLSRDSDGVGGIQPSVSSTGAGDMVSSRGVEMTLNLMAPSFNSMDARSSGQSASLAVAGPMHAAVVPGSKQGGGRAKGAGGPPAAAPGGPQLATQGSFTERVPSAGGPAVGMTSPTQGLTLGGQNMASSHGGRQGPVGQHAQMKVSQRPAPGALSGATAVPTAPGTNLQAVLAAAMAKNSQGQQSQRTVQGGSNSSASANANSGTTARMGTAMTGPPVSSGGSPMLSMAPPTKISGANAAKSSSSAPSSFPVGQKGGAGGSKRASSPSSGGMLPSILGPNIAVQNMPSKTSQPQAQVQGQGQGKGPHQHVGVQLLSSHQGQFPPHLLQQQQQQQQQHQMMRQSMFQQHHQQQQSPHFHSSQPGSPHLQPSQQGPPHQQPTPAPQAQQIPSHQQNQQQQQMHLQQQQASHPQQQFGGPAGNGSLAFSSGLSMGAGNNSSAGGGGRSSNSESGGVPASVRLLQSVKPAGGGSNGGASGGGQRGNGGPGGGPAFLQQQFGASGAASPGGQQSGSPRNSAASGYGGGNANAGAGGAEQVNGMRMVQGAAQARGAGGTASSPGMQGSSQRGQSGGAGPTKAGGGQYSGFGDGGQSRTSAMVSNSSSAPQGGGSNSSGQMNSSGTNVQSVGNGRPAYNGGPLHQGASGQGQVQATASLGTAGAAVVPSGPAAVLGPKPPTSVVQQ